MSRKLEDLKRGTGAHRLVAVAALVIMGAAVPCVQAAESGMRVVKDPVTGQLRAPSAEEATAMERQEKQQATLRRAPALKLAPAVTLRKDGSKKAVLDESSLSYSVMTRNADGSLNFECVTGAKAAQDIVSGDKPSSSSLSESKQEHAHHDHQ